MLLTDVFVIHTPTNISLIGDGEVIVELYDVLYNYAVYTVCPIDYFCWVAAVVLSTHRNTASLQDLVEQHR